MKDCKRKEWHLDRGKYVKKARCTFRARRKSGYLSENLLQRPWRKKLKSTKKETLWSKKKKDEMLRGAERIVATIKGE